MKYGESIVKRSFSLEKFKSFLEAQSPETRVYIGADSERLRIRGKKLVEYCVAVVVHIDGAHGCKVFGEVVREEDTRERLDRPFNRMIREANQAIDMYLRLEDTMIECGFEPEIHLDINPNEEEGSSCAVKAAVGMVKGICNVVPLVKPDAFAASFTADRLDRVLREQEAV